MRRYKTLLEYKINCPVCRSYNTMHNECLSKSILNKTTPAELLNLTGNIISIEFDIKNIHKYSTSFYSPGNSGKIKNVDKEYFYLDEVHDTVLSFPG